MIINVWSTPRTGSVWYSYWLQTQYTGSVVLNELFNKNNTDLYYYKSSSGIENHHSYFDGCFYKDYYIQDEILSIRDVFEKRSRSPRDEEAYLIDMLDNYNDKRIIIMHNHVDPIDESIRKHLSDTAYRNIYLYRKDKRAQLSSYAIALSTKQFVAFKPSQISTGIVPDIDAISLVRLIDRIKIWDSLEKEESIAYEDITFIEIPGLPIRQNHNHRNRLSDKMNNIIDELVSEYEYCKNK